MRVKSSIYPKKVEIIETKDGFSTIALRKNVNSVIEEDSLMDEEIHLYEYDEVKVKARHRRNIIDSIKSDFNAWFTKGIKLESLQEEIEQRQKETKALIEEYKQIDINNDLAESHTASFSAIAELYLAREDLEGSKVELEENNLMVMEAIAEIYDMVAGEV